MGEVIEAGETREPVMVPAALNPSALLSIATEKGASVEVLERLLALQERWEASEARKAFNAALLEFKRNPPRIVKDKLVKIPNGPTYKHAELDQVVEVITPALSTHGLSFRWEVAQNGEQITVRCVVSHVAGHSVATEITATPDDSGKKNPIQSVASTVTYLQRYTLLAATGLAAGAEDDDGRGSKREPEPTLTEEQVLNLRAKLQEGGPGEETLFLKWAKCDSLSQILQKNYKYSLERIENRLKRKGAEA